MRKEEKENRKALQQEGAERERANAEARMPLSKEELKELFDWVDERLQGIDCDNTLSHTLIFLRDRNLTEELIVPWLGEYGGFCDCEVIANVENEWGEIIGSI
jgi:hypothetical protein